MVAHPLVMKNATKFFGGFLAVNQMSFEVPNGKIVGFLGPNGAGKSTSLRMALGVMNPDSGSAELFGGPPVPSSLARVGFLPEERGLYKKMTPRSSIAYFAQLKGMSSREAHNRADELLKTAGLQNFARTKNSKLSKGMAQKVQILSTLAHRPEFLILDEPFSGLDPVNQQELEDLIRAEHERGATILFSTHVMEHAERLCDSIIMLARGEKVFDGTLNEAFATLDRGVRIELSSPDFDLGVTLAAKGYRAHRDSGDSSETEHSVWHIALDPGQDAQDVLRASIETGAPISSFAPDDARLRDVFVKFAGPQAAKALDASAIRDEAA
ncbi:MAG: ATP-binding cassette domain-containing protein [Pseudomonadota bacterium]